MKIAGAERDATYYDQKFAADSNFALHYTESPYYGLWAIILDRLRRVSAPRILEIGCGTGQLAHLLRDMRFVESYLGIDFSIVAIEKARATNPDWEFRCGNVFEDCSLEEEQYNTLLCTEFLEHVHQDLEVIARIRPFALVVASVPNFPHREHVRHFTSAREVYDRYISYFQELYVVPLPAHKAGLFHFLLQGYRNNKSDTLRGD